jgi:uncharacterized membrane protein YqjE
VSETLSRHNTQRHRPDGSGPTEPLEPDASVGELLSRVTDDFSALVRTHVDLAKVEIKEEVARAGKGAGLLTGGAIAGLFAVLMLSFALAWGLAELVDAGWAFLIVGLIWAAVATGLALTGRKELRTVDPVPQTTTQTIKDDIEWAKEQR